MPAYKYEKNGKTYWYCAFYYKDWMGINKKKKKQGFSTRKEALEWERAFLDQGSKSAEITFRALSAEYMNDCQSRMKPTTLNGKQYLIEKKLLPYFGHMPISEITPLTIRKWQNILVDFRDEDGQPYSQTYLKSIHNQMSAIMNYAVKYYQLPNNPCIKSGSIGRTHAEKMDIWTREDFETFIKYENKEVYRIAFNLLYYTGMRRGELLALTPADIKDGYVSINKNYETVQGVEYFLTPKTDKSKRTIPIHKALYDDIRAYIDGIYIEDDERIFYFQAGGLTSEFNKITKKAGLKKIRLHYLRHSHASLLISMKVPITVIAERLGHESPQTTLRTYSHFFEEDNQSVAEQIADLFEV